MFLYLLLVGLFGCWSGGSVAVDDTHPSLMLPDICNKELVAELREQSIVQPSRYNDSVRCNIKITSDKGILFLFRDLSFLKLNTGCQEHHNNYIIIDLDDRPYKEDKCSSREFATRYLYRSRGYLQIAVSVDLTAARYRRNAANVAVDFRFSKVTVVDLCIQDIHGLNTKTLLTTPGFPNINTDMKNCTNRLKVGFNQTLIFKVLDVVSSALSSNGCACFVQLTGSERLCLNSTVIGSSFEIYSSVNISVSTVPTGGLACALLLLVDVNVINTAASIATNALLASLIPGNKVLENPLSGGTLLSYTTIRQFASKEGLSSCEAVVWFAIAAALGAASGAVIFCFKYLKRSSPKDPSAINFDQAKSTSGPAAALLKGRHLETCGSDSNHSNASNALMNSCTLRDFFEKSLSRDSAVKPLDHIYDDIKSISQDPVVEPRYADLVQHRDPISQHAVITFS